MKNINYVVGFLFSPCCCRVALIQKGKPEWQLGKWNGIGGKIEKGESALRAMRREFFEETGMVVDDWIPFCSLDTGRGYVDFFTAKGDITQVRTMTPEPVRCFYADRLPVDVIPNLKWLVPLAQEYGQTVVNAVIIQK